MSAEISGQKVTTEEAAAAGSGSAPIKGGWKCPLSDAHVHKEDVRKVWKECQEESFWYRALPLSLGSMAVTGGLIYQGIWKSSKRFGPFPKLAVAGILGFAVGKASYVGTCRSKFQELSIQGGPGIGPWSKRDHPGHRHREGSTLTPHHDTYPNIILTDPATMCVKKNAPAAPAEQA